MGPRLHHETLAPAQFVPGLPPRVRPSAQKRGHHGCVPAAARRLCAGQRCGVCRLGCRCPRYLRAARGGTQPPASAGAPPQPPLPQYPTAHGGGACLRGGFRRRLHPRLEPASPRCRAAAPRHRCLRSHGSLVCGIPAEQEIPAPVKAIVHLLRCTRPASTMAAARASATAVSKRSHVSAASSISFFSGADSCSPPACGRRGAETAACSRSQQARCRATRACASRSPKQPAPPQPSAPAADPGGAGFWQECSQAPQAGRRSPCCQGFNTEARSALRQPALWDHPPGLPPSP